MQLETDLKIEREWRQTLQSELERERETITQLTAKAQQINGLKKVFWLLLFYIGKPKKYTAIYKHSNMFTVNIYRYYLYIVICTL